MLLKRLSSNHNFLHEVNSLLLLQMLRGIKMQKNLQRVRKKGEKKEMHNSIR